MEIKLSKAWSRKLQARLDRFDCEVGILDDKPHKNPLRGGLFDAPQLKNYAGGPISRTSREKSGKTIGQVLIENMMRLNINLLQRPFQEKSAPILKFTKAFLQLALEHRGISAKRVENLLQAIVRNPILRLEYGRNKASTADNKGFDRHLFDTGQMFKAIKAKVKRV